LIISARTINQAKLQTNKCHDYNETADFNCNFVEINAERWHMSNAAEKIRSDLNRNTYGNITQPKIYNNRVPGKKTP